MSGYKRVNFYELCRLCATNQQKHVTTHIFKEEGRKMQLQEKINTCLALKVEESDSLPKVVCSKCLLSLEQSNTFRTECVKSELMLSSYFNNYRYTPDFTESGKVYIKDTSAPSLLIEALAIRRPTNLPILIEAPKIATQNTPAKIHHSTTTNTITINSQGEVINIAEAETPPKPPLKHKKSIIIKQNTVLVDNSNLSYSSPPPKPPKQRIKTPHTKILHSPTSPTMTQQIEAQNNLYQMKTVNTGNMAYNNYVETYYNNPGPSNNWENNMTSVKQNDIQLSTINLDSIHNEANLAAATLPSEKNHVCDVCAKSFKRREHLYQHIKLHSGFRPFNCAICSKAFMRKEHLLRHQTSHSGQKNYTCPVCDKSFSRNDNLLKHRKTHEKSQTSYECDMCPKVFVLKHYYVTHKLTHENNTATSQNTNCWPKTELKV